MGNYYNRQISFGPSITPTVKMLIITNVIVFGLQLFFNYILKMPIDSYFALNTNSVNLLYIYQLFTYSFLHANFVHILFNMLSLWMFGSEIEALWGKRNFIALYLFSGLLGGLVSWSLHTALGETVSVVGASGGIYGLLLTYAFLWPNREIIFLIFPIKMKYFVLILLAMIAFASGGRVDHYCHAGGALAGVLFFFARKNYSLDFNGKLSPSYLIQKWKMKKYQEEMYKRQNAKDRVDEILEKISKKGMKSLTRKEKQFLKEASHYYEDK
ncbi:MAG: rhomboid family intramembrane serine protease [Spirochaetota bacterium]